MRTPFDSIDLNGQLLIAMPGMNDPRFANSVILICSHSEEGAMGLIVNKPTRGLQMTDLLEQLKISQSDKSRNIGVQFGGPVEHGRGFVLHSTDYSSEGATMDVGEKIWMTATQEILEAIAGGSGPKLALLMIGYAGWGPGQLETEIKENGWLVAGASSDIVFGADCSAKWTDALQTLGVDPLLLSSTAGRA